jgi:hypothetical protein
VCLCSPDTCNTFRDNVLNAHASLMFMPDAMQVVLLFSVAAQPGGWLCVRLAEYLCYTKSSADADRVYALCRKERAAPLTGPHPLCGICSRLFEQLAAMPVAPGLGMVEMLTTQPARPATAPSDSVRAVTLRPSDVQTLANISDSQSWRLSEGATQALRDCGASLTPSSAQERASVAAQPAAGATAPVAAQASAAEPDSSRRSMPVPALHALSMKLASRSGRAKSEGTKAFVADEAQENTSANSQMDASVVVAAV